jgi:hypothetical protein
VRLVAQMTRLSPQLVEVASWRVAAELVRRYPGLTVIETHPGGGQYDCLSILGPSGHLDLNRQGSAHVLEPFSPDAPGGPWADFWDELAAAPDPKETLDRLCALAGLPAMPVPPPATPASAAYGFVAAFLTHATFGRVRWECRNGYHDSAGMEGSGVNGGLFIPFPAAEEALGRHDDGDVLGQAAYRFWFLLREGKPKLCLEAPTGLAYDLAGAVHDLLALHRSRRHTWQVVSRVAGDLLP